MPALIEGAVDLVLIAGILLIIGFLYATRFTLTPVIRVLHSALHWIPGLGGMVDKAEAAVFHAIDAAIDASQRALAELFTGITWSIQTTANAIHDLGKYTEQALNHLRHTTLPRVVNAAAGGVAGAVDAVDGKVTDAIRAVAHDVNGLKGDADAARRAAEAYALREVHAAEVRLANAIADAAQSLTVDAGRLVHSLDDRLSDRIDRVAGSVAAQAAGAVTTAERYADHALDAARGAIEAAATAAAGIAARAAVAAAGNVGQATGITHADVDAALSRAMAAVDAARADATVASAAVLAAAEAEIADLRAALPADVVPALDDVRAGLASAQTAVAGLAGDVPRLVDQEIERLGGLSQGASAAALAALAATVTAIAVESGLENAGCRQKVKRVCQTDPLAWEALLAGLVPLAVGFSFADLADVAASAFSRVDGLVDELA